MGDTPEESQAVHEEVSSLLEQARDLQEAAASLVSTTRHQEDALRQRVTTLDSRINALLAEHRASSNPEKWQAELKRAKYILSEGDAAAFLPNKSRGGFLRMFLGPISVKANSKDVQLKVKQEYNDFRDRTALLFLCLPSLLLVLKSWAWNGCLPALPVQLYQAWLLCLYTSLALRENILRVNGSDIRPWWIKHHYGAMAMALISLTWDIETGTDCSRKQSQGVIDLFLKWAVMQGVAMLLQNRYQRQRLYTRITLGKARRMDVVWGETAGVEGQLLLLCPILFILQGFEAFVGVLFLKTAFVGISSGLEPAIAGISSHWQVITSGVLLIVMAVGNFLNTVQTLLTKSRVKAKVRKEKQANAAK